MKKLMLLMVFASLVTTYSYSQDDKKMKHDKMEWEKKMKDDLKLTAEQSEKYDALNKEYGDKMYALSSDASLTKEAQKEQKMALKKEKESKLMSILTPEQQTQYKAMMDKKKKDKTPKAGF